MKKLFILFFLAKGAFAQKTIQHDSLNIEGNQRTFHFLPSSKPKASLVFVLHGSNGNGLQMRKATEKLEAASQKENILLVYPDAYKKFWNECRKTANSEANHLNINDNAFFAQMIDYFVAKYRVDPKKIFVVGTSGGGHMAYKLALTMPEKITAITALIANLPTPENLDCEERHKAIPVLIINGTNDNINPYEGGEVKLGANLSLGFVRSTAQTFDYFKALAQYKTQPKELALPDTDPTDGRTLVKYTLKARKKPEVTLIKVNNGKHDYPNDLDVHMEAWAFFKRQIKP